MVKRKVKEIKRRREAERGGNKGRVTLPSWGRSGPTAWWATYACFLF